MQVLKSVIYRSKVSTVAKYLRVKIALPGNPQRKDVDSCILCSVECVTYQHFFSIDFSEDAVLTLKY